MTTQIINGKVLTPQGWIDNGTVVFEDNIITYVGEGKAPIEGAEIYDARGNYVVPGGIDMHCHGAGGRDFMECDEAAFRTIIDTHRQFGTTSLFPTLASSSTEMIEKAIGITEKLMKEPGRQVLGLHLEGPYLNPSMAGGQIPEYMTMPDPVTYRRLLDSTDCIKRWDASPELAGAIEFGKFVSDRGIVAGIAHTTAGYEIVSDAFAHGYSHVTHFYNAMPGFHKVGEYKQEGTVESVYLIDDLTVEVIADGIHVPPAILRLIHKIKGADRMCLVTDALACTACEDAEAFDPRVMIEDGVCKLKDRSALAGSVATMDRLIRTIVQKAGIPLEDAIKMSSLTPARIMHVDDRKGSLEVGKDADIVIYNQELFVEKVF